MSAFRVVLCALYAVALCPLAGAQNPVYQTRRKPFAATVKLVALSSSARQAYAGSQDTYLAMIVQGREEKGQLVKLVDRYRVYDDPIRRSVLQAQHPLRMRLTRDEGCDTRVDFMHASFDPADTFDPSLSSQLQDRGSSTLPCFAVDHGATRLSK